MKVDRLRGNAERACYVSDGASVAEHYRRFVEVNLLVKRHEPENTPDQLLVKYRIGGSPLSGDPPPCVVTVRFRRVFRRPNPLGA